jgi:hypothetical protein
MKWLEGNFFDDRGILEPADTPENWVWSRSSISSAGPGSGNNNTEFNGKRNPDEMYSQQWRPNRGSSGYR